METNDEHIRKLTGNRNPEENYKMPDGYFDNFSSTVKEKIDARHKPQKAPVFARLLRPVYAIPALSLVVVAVSYFAFFSKPTTNGSLANGPATVADSTDITIEEMEQYFASNIALVGIEDDIDQDLMVYALDLNEEIPAQTQKQEGAAPITKPDTTTDPSDEDIEEYLINNADEIFFENL
jgi:hypothetical protein